MSNESLIKDAQRWTKHAPVAVGSRVICPNACADDSDWDYLVQVSDLHECALGLIGDGWDANGVSLAEEREIDTRFVSLRKANVNLIVTEHQKFFDGFSLATRVATKLGLTSKDHRIQLFQAILYGNG